MGHGPRGRAAPLADDSEAAHERPPPRNAEPAGFSPVAGPVAAPVSLLDLQGTAGNAAVLRLLRARSADPGPSAGHDPGAGMPARPGPVSDQRVNEQRAAEEVAERLGGGGAVPGPVVTQRTAVTTVAQAADTLTMALGMPNAVAHREAIFKALLDVGDARRELADAFLRTAGRPLEAALRAGLPAKDWLRARSYLRHGRLRTADKIILAADGFGTDERTLYRLMREARADFAATEADLADYADLYAQTAKLFHLAAGSRIAGILGAELSDWELDKARATLAFGQLRPVDELRVATNRSGTDEDTLFSALRRAQPATIAEEWRQYYGDDAGGDWSTLDGLLADELSGDDLDKARAMVAGTWDVRSQIRMAVEGLGTKESAIWDALEHLTSAERSVLQLEWCERRGIWNLLRDDLDDDDMHRAESLILGGSDALSRLQQAGATSGSAIVDAVKLSHGAALEAYRAEWNSTTSGFRSWVSARTDAGEQAGIHAILFGTPREQLRWAVAGLGTDEDYIFHVLGGLSDEAKAAVAADTGLLADLEADLSTSDHNRVLDLLRRSDLSLEQQVAATDAQIERERSWLTDAFSGTSDALADEQRELHSMLGRARTDAELSPEEQRLIGLRHAATQEALATYIEARDEIEDLAANILTTAAAIVVSICTAGAGAGVGAAMIASQLAAQAARVALISAVARVMVTKVARGDRFDAFGTDGAIAFGAGALDGVMNVLSAGAAQTLINPAFRAAASAEARVAAVQAWEQSVGRRLLHAAVEGGMGGGIGAAFETSADESTWKGGIEQGFRNVAGATAGGALTGAAVSAATTGATAVVGHVGGGDGAGTHLPPGRARADLEPSGAGGSLGPATSAAPAGQGPAPAAAPAAGDVPVLMPRPPEPLVGEGPGAPGQRDPSPGAGGRPPERRAWVHPEESEQGRFHPLPDVVPVVHGRGSGLSEGELLTSYADALRSSARRNPATAAARSEAGPYIRDNLYTGPALTNAVDRLQEHGILTVPDQGGSAKIDDPDRYVRWLERAYRQHQQARLDPRMREAILGYVGRREPLRFFGKDLQTGTGSSGGPLPGTHAELLAINDLLVNTDLASPASVATVRARTGDHFAACVHCGGIIDRLPAGVRVLVWTGRATPTP